MTARRKPPRKKPAGETKRNRLPATQQNKDHFFAADQRTHLILTRTGPNGTQQLQLDRAIFEHEWQNRLALATANTAFSALEKDFSTETIARLGEQALAGISTLVTHLLSNAQPAVACRGGCDHCCHQRVGVTPVEAALIALHIRATSTPAQLDELRLRLATFVDQTQELTGAERYSPLYACPLLKDHLCSVYAVRPLSCRGVHSFDQKACEDELRDPEMRAAFLRGELPGHAFREPVQAVYAVSAGLQLALSEQFALDMRPLDLAQALHALIGGEEPLALVQKWLDGLPVLAHAQADRRAKEDLDRVSKQDLGLPSQE